MCSISTCIAVEALKLVFCIFNFLVMIFAIVIIILSAVSHEAGGELLNAASGDSAPKDTLVTMPVAIFVLCLGFLGCCGASPLGNILCLYPYAITMFGCFLIVIIYTFTTCFRGTEEEREEQQGKLIILSSFSGIILVAAILACMFARR